MKKLFLFLLTVFLFCNISNAQNVNIIERELQEALNQEGDTSVRVNIIFKEEMNVDELRSSVDNISDKNLRRDVVVKELKAFSEKSQNDVISILKSAESKGTASKIKSHWLSNSINCTISKELVYILSEHKDIAMIGLDVDKKLVCSENPQKVESMRGLTENITHVNADDVWAEGYTGEGVVVAVLDSGVNYNHVDLADHLWDGGEEFPNHGYNCRDDNHETMDYYMHGTHCAGTVCGDGTSGTATGMAPDATLMIVKILDNYGNGTADNIVSGMEFATEHDADVMSLSLGIAAAQISEKVMMRQTCVNALEAGVIAAVAVGNEGNALNYFPLPNNVRTPGSCPPPWIHPNQQSNAGALSCVVAVGAVDYNNAYANFSSIGPSTWQGTSFNDYHYVGNIGLIRPDVVAPGVGIVSLDFSTTDGHVSYDGTSQATPCVAGVMCLLLQKNPYLTPAEISMALETTCTSLSETKNNQFGSGCIDALAAIESINEGSPFPIIDIVSCSTESMAANEDVTITVTLQNNGYVATTDNTNVTLSSNDQYMNIIDGNASYPVMNVGATATGTFVIRAEENTPHNREINFNITATNSGNTWNHSFSIKVINNCSKPTNLNAEALDENSIELTWNDSYTAVSYKVFRDEELIANVNEPSYIDTGLNPGTEYCYTVRSVCEIGTSLATAEECATTIEATIPCETPNNITSDVEQGTNDFDHFFKVTLSWNEVEEADSYNIYLNNEKIDNINETSFVIGFDEETTHNFAISSLCGEQESGLSDDITVTLIDDAIDENNIVMEIHPNPANDKIFIDTDENIKQIKIYNITGVMVYENNEYENHVDVSKLSNGIYFINIKTEKGEIIKKIIKQ